MNIELVGLAMGSGMFKVEVNLFSLKYFFIISFGFFEL